MHPKIIEAIKDRYRGDDSTAIIRAKKSGAFELILVSLGTYDLLKKILKELKDQRNKQVVADKDIE